MVGALVMLVAMVVVVPVGIMLAGAVWSALFGVVATTDAVHRAEETTA